MSVRGRVSRALLGAAAFIASLVVGALLAPQPTRGQVLSPGHLTRAHAELDNEVDCNRCHEGGRRISISGCLDCHRDLRARIRARQGLHGREYRGQDCGRCHTEHIGRSARLVRWPSGSMESFDHGDAGWPLRGAHRQTECRECHDRRNSRGHRTFLGLASRCASCHEDAHDGRFGGDCASCHNETRWNSVSIERIDHDRTRFPLRGRHRQLECAQCHHEPPQWRGLSFGSCASCHSDPHGGSLGSACAECHVEQGWDNVDRVRAHHPGLSLARGHSDVGCRRCHDAGLMNEPSRGTRCVSCHRNTHEAEFGNNCAQCHRGIRWLGLPRRIGLAAHERTPYPLVGEHSEVDCGGCHRRELAVAERYRGLEFENCSSCHSDPHGGWTSFADSDCQSCHSPHGFEPSSFDAAQHAHAAFPLDGMHTAVPCSGCHGDDEPRTSFRVEGQACADCHENPHGDQFAAEMAQGGCASCHHTAGWDRPVISHDTWPLTGAHADAQCTACHSPSEEDRRTGRGASYRGVPRVCSGCHEDIHLGQFRLEEPIRPCETCHGTTSFDGADESFDHEGLAEYPLVGRHAELECVSCHRVEALSNGEEAQRWRLGYRECADCHADPHDPAASGPATPPDGDDGDSDDGDSDDGDSDDGNSDDGDSDEGDEGDSETAALSAWLEAAR